MDLHQLRFENDGLYGQNEQLQENIKNLEGEVKNLKSKLSNANAHTEQGNAAFARIEKTHNLLQAAHSKLQESCKAELEDLKHKNNSLAGSVSGTDKAKGRVETALAEAKKQLKVSPPNFRAIEHLFHPHHSLDAYRWATL
jgi:chromosome segregation ATPase